METIKDRLIKFLAFIEIGQGKFEKNCGLSNGTVNNIKEGGMTTQKVEKILLTYPELNIDWLITGRGEMKRQSSGIASKDNLKINDMDMKTLLDVIRRQNARLDELEREIADLRRKYEPLEERPAV